MHEEEISALLEYPNSQNLRNDHRTPDYAVSRLNFLFPVVIERSDHVLTIHFLINALERNYVKYIVRNRFLLIQLLQCTCSLENFIDLKYEIISFTIWMHFKFRKS